MILLCLTNFAWPLGPMVEDESCDWETEKSLIGKEGKYKVVVLVEDRALRARSSLYLTNESCYLNQN